MTALSLFLLDSIFDGEIFLVYLLHSATMPNTNFNPALADAEWVKDLKTQVGPNVTVNQMYFPVTQDTIAR